MVRLVSILIVFALLLGSLAAAKNKESNTRTKGSVPLSPPSTGKLPVTGGDYLALQQRVINLYDQYKDAVVQVEATMRGTGFFTSRDAHIFVNASVIHGAEQIRVRHHGIIYSAKLKGEDVFTNLALIQLDKKPLSFGYIQLPEHGELPVVGTMCMAVSCPLGLSPQPGLGFVTGRDSRFEERLFPTPYLRTDLSTVRGGHGAPVLDLNGQLLGMTMLSVPEIQMSYVLPARSMRRVRDDLLFSGKVQYGYVGMMVEQFLDAEQTNRFYLSKILPKSPAEKAGLQVGDQLLRFGHTHITDYDDIRSAAFFARAGESVPVRVRRGKQELELPVHVGSKAEVNIETIVSEIQEKPLKPTTAPSPTMASEADKADPEEHVPDSHAGLELRTDARPSPALSEDSKEPPPPQSFG